ncbi:MAG: hypothetical protein ACREFO_21155 [Acetobacteraceae bacterium]
MATNASTRLSVGAKRAEGQTQAMRGTFTVIVILVLLVLGAGFLALGEFPPAAPRPGVVTKVIPARAVGAN